MTISFAKIHSVGSTVFFGFCTISRLFDALRRRRAAFDLQNLLACLDRRGGGLRHRQQSADRLRADAAADELRPFLRFRALIGAEIVHLRHVTARALHEDDGRTRAEAALDGFFEVLNPVGRNAAGIRRGVAGVVDHDADKLTLHVPGTDHTDLRVDGTGVFEDVGIARAGMTPTLAVFHAQAAVEGDFVLMAEAKAELHRHFASICRHDTRDDLIRQTQHIASVGAGGLFIRELLHEVGGGIVFARHHHADRAGTMRM
jgi:hypothetical protein